MGTEFKPNGKIDCSCGNCDWKGDSNDLYLDVVDDLAERLSPGETVPAGECPECGALVHLIKDEEPPAAIPAPILAAARAYAEDLSSGFDDGTYEKTPEGLVQFEALKESLATYDGLPDELAMLRRVAEAARNVDIGLPSAKRLAAFEALGAALVAYNGAPLAFRGRLNPDASVYAVEAPAQVRGEYVPGLDPDAD